MSERIPILWFGQFCEAINNYENIEIENREGRWEKYHSNRGYSLAKLELEFIGMKFSYFEKGEPAQYNATPPSNEWPCKPECGYIKLSHSSNGGWEARNWNSIESENCVRPDWKQCPKCGSKRPAEKKDGSPTGSAYLDAIKSTTESMRKNFEEKPEAKAECWMSPCIETAFVGSEKLRQFSIFGDNPLTIQIRRDVPEIDVLENEPDDMQVKRKLNIIIRVINSLRTIEGQMYVKVKEGE